jgi:hypothetical protein
MHPLEITIGLRQGGPEGMNAVREMLAKYNIYVLGQPAGDTSIPGQGTESDLLHFTIDDETTGGEKVMLPCFTNEEAIAKSLVRNPEWQTLSVLMVHGGALLEHLEDDVTIVIDPWTEFEWQLPLAQEEAR